MSSARPALPSEEWNYLDVDVLRPARSGAVCITCSFVQIGLSVLLYAFHLLHENICGISFQYKGCEHLCIRHDPQIVFDSVLERILRLVYRNSREFPGKQSQIPLLFRCMHNSLHRCPDHVVLTLL